jgi:cephalosporin-C deacetylase-like acetyl esterase
LDGKEYRGLATAGFDPAAIKPTVANPSDFVSFWETAKTELAKIPIDARMTLLPERCTETVNVYHVNLQNYRLGARLYGILCVPKKEGKYPALLLVPGAGTRPYGGDITTAEKGIITFQIGIHGIPVNLDVSVYNSLGAGALNQYPFFNLDNRDKYYFKRVYMGCVRANDFITSLPQFDGTHLGVTGGSQGGALSIITAGLDSRVKYLAAFFPALCDVTGYLHGRAGGWPHVFSKDNLAYNNTKDKIETCGYYDVVNFARLVKIPGMYSWGFNDETCPPTSMYAAFNVIAAPKPLHLVLETGHWTYPEQTEKLGNWIVDKLKGGN